MIKQTINDFPYLISPCYTCASSTSPPLPVGKIEIQGDRYIDTIQSSKERIGQSVGRYTSGEREPRRGLSHR